MNIKEGSLKKDDVLREYGTNERNWDYQTATRTDNPQKRCAEHWQGINHPQSGVRLKVDYELYKNNESGCLYAQFSDKEGNQYYYIPEDGKTVGEQIHEDQERAQQLHQDRDR